MYPHSHGARRNQTFMPANAVHAFKVWKDAGYSTGLIGKNHCFQRPEDLDLFDVWCEISHGGLVTQSETKGMAWYRSTEGIAAAHELRRMMVPQNPKFGYATDALPLEDHSTGLVAGQTVRYLEHHRREPFALWVSFPDPHEPWVVPESYAALYPPDKIELPPWREGEFDTRAPERNRVLYEMLGLAGVALEEIYGLLGVYYGMVQFIDDALGQILDALVSFGLRDRTIVVFCSDHGDFMGEHHMQCKGGVFYDCLTRIPLILSWPGQVDLGKIEGSLVSLIDIVPTLLELQRLDVPSSMQGMGLPGVTDASPRCEAFAEYGAGGPPFRLDDLQKLSRPHGRQTLIQSLQWREAEGRRKMIRTRDWKYVHDPMGDRDELYDLVHDPWELYNVVDLAQHREVLSELRLRLLDWSISTEDAEPVPLPPNP
jgi:arylsulfatase A-like enzyme